MADVSIANLPALAGNMAPGDLFVMVDVSDTSESPLGTTKRMPFSQANISSITGSLTISPGPLTVSGNVAGNVALAVNNVNATGYGASIQGGDASHYALEVLDAAATPLLVVMTGKADFSGNLGVGAAGSQLAIGDRVNTLRFARNGPGAVVLVGDDNGFADIQVRTAISAVVQTSNLVASNEIIFGPDPGGSQMFRVGGSSHFQDVVVTSNLANGSGLAVFNTNTTGTGIFSKGGGIAGKHVGQFANVNGDICLSIQDPAPLTNQTSLLLRCSFVAGTSQVGFASVLIGPSGSGPNGQGRVLYVAL